MTPKLAKLLRKGRCLFPLLPDRTEEEQGEGVTNMRKETSTTLLDLPEDPLVHVLSMLDPSSLATMANTSRSGCRIAQSSVLWMSLCLKAWGLPSCLPPSALAKTVDINKLSSIYPSIVAWPSELETEATPRVMLGGGLPLQQQQQPPLPGQPQPPTAFKVFEDDTHTVQYVGDGLGQGNRAVRSTTPFPSLVLPEDGDEWSSMWDRLARSLRLPRSSFPSSTATTSSAALMAAAAMMNHMRPPALFRSNSHGSSTGGGGSTSSSASSKAFSAPWTREDGAIDVAPRRLGYYEVTIKPRLDASASVNNLPVMMMQEGGGEAGPVQAPAVVGGGGNNCVAVGLASQEFPLEGYMPGWDATSYAFHSDDGGIFHGTGIKVRYYGSPYGVGDVVGCGLDYNAREIFFTLNGKYLGVAFTDVKGTLFPTVGIDSKNPVALNFGERPFVFDMDSYAEVKKAAAVASTATSNEPVAGGAVVGGDEGDEEVVGGLGGIPLEEEDEEEEFGAVY